MRDYSHTIPRNETITDHVTTCRWCGYGPDILHKGAPACSGNEESMHLKQAGRRCRYACRRPRPSDGTSPDHGRVIRAKLLLLATIGGALDWAICLTCLFSCMLPDSDRPGIARAQNGWRGIKNEVRYVSSSNQRSAAPLCGVCGWLRIGGMELHPVEHSGPGCEGRGSPRCVVGLDRETCPAVKTFCRRSRKWGGRAPGNNFHSPSSCVV